MEVDCKDLVAREKCLGKSEAIVAAVQRHLGFASVVSVYDIPGKGLKLETETGHIVVDYDLTKIADEET